MAAPLPSTTGASRLLWSPWLHVDAPDNGADALRRTTINCIRAWQCRYGPLIAGVSGGLDSSIVACSLSRETPIHALTISTGDPQGDESSYAAALCDALEMPLITDRYTLQTVDIRRPSLPHKPIPGGMAQLQAYDAVVINSVRATGARAFMSGVGGDNVFHLTRSARPLIDRLLATGSILGSLRTLEDIVRITGASRTTVIREAMRVPRGTGSKYLWPVDTRFLAASVVADLAGEPLEHPWLNAPPACLPGKHAHIAMIVRAHAYLECHDRRWGFASLHPLMSQPIIELALSTPSWIACEGGADRARARHAFVADLPTSVLERRLKGGPDGFALKVIGTQIEAIRERLLEGRLVHAGVVHRPVLEEALTETNLARGRDYTRLLQFLDTEAWIEHWLSFPAALKVRPSSSLSSAAPPLGDVRHPATCREART